MTEPNWQKSTYSEEGSACVYLATGPCQLAALTTTLKPAAVNRW
ncbi:DUF397 domain-containing protein [Streptomyces sp. NBC_01275]|nr:DUF397 domain-containing protein [Streptomyces sp. NBC_01275]MCX4764529.1 DUF397 domain-containing protein [Streptomyces sp. NBC_01275]